MIIKLFVASMLLVLVSGCSKSHLRLLKPYEEQTLAYHLNDYPLPIVTNIHGDRFIVEGGDFK